MELRRIAELLAPFLSAPLADSQLQQLALYLQLLQRWNARMNLTAVSKPEQIVTRHFGESLFVAARGVTSATELAIDVGSGAGFPGLPLKISAPHVRVFLVESQYRKATFLREVVRALGLRAVEVLPVRAEQLLREHPASADLVTMRAVERFEASLPVAAGLVRPQSGRLALLIGARQVPGARKLLPGFSFPDPIPVPGSAERVLLLASADLESTGA